MTHTYEIKGMHCGSCVSKVTAALKQVAGVTGAEVKLDPPQARVEMSEHVATSRLADAVARAGAYTLTNGEMEGMPAIVANEQTPKESLYPLLLIIGYIAGAVIVIAFASHIFSIVRMMNHFMAGFFLVFSFFKLLNLNGFADAYQSYDVLARRIPVWGFVYPFVELALGIAYLANFAPLVTNIATLALMLLGSVGVLKALLDKRAIRCACLGTVLNLPMTKVTLVEDLGMAAMAAAMLVLMLT